VRFSKISSWNGGYNGRLRIINHSTPVTHGWTLEFDFGDEILSPIWGDGVLVSSSGGHITISEGPGAEFLIPETWRDILFSANTLTSDEPSGCLFNGEACTFVMDIDGSLPDPIFADVADTDPLPDVPLADWFSQEDFDAIFGCADAAGFAANGMNCAVCMRVVDGQILPLADDGEPMYTYRGFLEVLEYIQTLAVAELMPFVNVGDPIKNKQELAAFFANVTQETGAWSTEDGQNCGLTVWEEVHCQVHADGSPNLEGCPNEYGPDMNCVSDTGAYGEPVGDFCCAQTGDARDCQYSGRGAIQLSWGDNYKELDQLLGLDYALLHNPYLLTSSDHTFVPDAVKEKLPSVRALVWLSAIYYWMHTRDFGISYIPSSHSLLYDPASFGECIPEGTSGFAETINNINGALECGSDTNERMLNRVFQYKRISEILEVPVVDGVLECGSQVTGEYKMPWLKSACPPPDPPNSACYPDPCTHGTCTDAGDTALCACAPGWSGTFCDTTP